MQPPALRESREQNNIDSNSDIQHCEYSYDQGTIPRFSFVSAAQMLTASLHVDLSLSYLRLY